MKLDADARSKNDIVTQSNSMSNVYHMIYIVHVIFMYILDSLMMILHTFHCICKFVYVFATWTSRSTGQYFADDESGE